MTDGMVATGHFSASERDLGERPIETVSPTGVLPYQALRAMIGAGEIASSEPFSDGQIQPASLDLRLGARAYRVRASFLPGPGATVLDKIGQLVFGPAIDLREGAVLEKGAVYVIELLERVRLNSLTEGIVNPKSSTGRLDVLTRLITDGSSSFDRIERGYRGPLYIEVAPQTFSIVVRQGSRLNQVRFQRGGTNVAAGEVARLYKSGQFVRVANDLPPLQDNLVPVTVDLIGEDKSNVVGYRAKKHAGAVDVDRPGYYDPNEFWEKIYRNNDQLVLDPDEFYILATREEVGVPPNLAAEMVPYNSISGEFRVHYAGFFDPGFGWDGSAEGSRAVLEVRAYGIPFMLDHGQIVGWLRYGRMTGVPDRIYGGVIKSNYQGQRVALAKHFKPFI